MRTGFLLTQGSHARRLMLAEGMGIKRAPDAAVLIAVFSAVRQYPVSADDVVHSGVTHRPPHTVTTREGDAIAQHWVMRM